MSLIILTAEFTFNMLPVMVKTDWILNVLLYIYSINNPAFLLMIQRVSFLLFVSVSLY